MLIDSYCGLCCETCEFRKTTNCGDCAEFPCDLLKRYSYDPVRGANGARIENVRQQKLQPTPQEKNNQTGIGGKIPVPVSVFLSETDSHSSSLYNQFMVLCHQSQFPGCF